VNLDDFGNYGARMRVKMQALDEMRQGFLWGAWQYLYPGRAMEAADLQAELHARFNRWSRARGHRHIADEPKWWTTMHWLKRELLKGGW
jgi:hypothetical protein